ncbi:hypothetical protein TNIN_10481 [Trichonephila inaurata madagascariensis]|uniref:Uncharacterized protein n=1 Tax=Trichonephila inaurata madagascariensis TaxID=2747483 RepID=A0A8X7BPC8_9ARAC|nr:hypothetical protein TNIN_10481 [Trichonephila inaurata madagascariensis]
MTTNHLEKFQYLNKSGITIETLLKRISIATPNKFLKCSLPTNSIRSHTPPVEHQPHHRCGNSKKENEEKKDSRPPLCQKEETKE